MKDHNGVLIMQRALLAGTLGLAMAQKAAAILEGEPGDPQADRSAQGAVLRAILDAANECLGYFDDRPAGERWCDTLLPPARPGGLRRRARGAGQLAAQCVRNKCDKEGPPKSARLVSKARIQD